MLSLYAYVLLWRSYRGIRKGSDLPTRPLSTWFQAAALWERVVLIGEWAAIIGLFGAVWGVTGQFLLGVAAGIGVSLVGLFAMLPIMAVYGIKGREFPGTTWDGASFTRRVRTG